MSLIKILPLLLKLGVALGSASAWGLPNDNEQSIHIQANEAQLDNKRGVATYKGDVIITQGSMKITGDTVTITRNAANEIEIVTSIGELAYFQQLQKAADSKPVQAYAATIQYHAPQNHIVLIDKAKVIHDGNTTEGEKIVYDMLRQVANAGRANGTNVTAPRPRVDMVIQPKKKTDPQKAQ